MVQHTKSASPGHPTPGNPWQQPEYAPAGHLRQHAPGAGSHHVAVQGDDFATYQCSASVTGHAVRCCADEASSHAFAPGTYFKVLNWYNAAQLNMRKASELRGRRCARIAGGGRVAPQRCVNCSAGTEGEPPSRALPGAARSGARLLPDGRLQLLLSLQQILIEVKRI